MWEIGNHTGQKTKVTSLKHWKFTEKILLAFLGLFLLLHVSSNCSLPGVETSTRVASDPSSVQLNPISAQPEAHWRSRNFVKYKFILGRKEGYSLALNYASDYLMKWFSKHYAWGFVPIEWRQQELCIWEEPQNLLYKVFRDSEGKNIYESSIDRTILWVS